MKHMIHTLCLLTFCATLSANAREDAEATVVSADDRGTTATNRQTAEIQPAFRNPFLRQRRIAGSSGQAPTGTPEPGVLYATTENTDCRPSEKKRVYRNPFLRTRQIGQYVCPD